ncbi:MAG: HEAT repeat domain-containing protein [Caldilineaceae bacterium]|nr:HEAT repeat domain-containing protein [Caldilineaceae bacterium]
MGKQKGMNKHQKAAFRPGEKRTRRDQIETLLELSCSADPADREVAAQNLCPCHVRRRVEPVWEALYRMMEDPDVRVRRAAWHTLEDGGRPNDPAFEPILSRALRQETDPQVRRFAELFARARAGQEQVALARAAAPAFPHRGRCDFCGADNVPVRRDFETELDTLGQVRRHAHVCAQCA